MLSSVLYLRVNVHSAEVAYSPLEISSHSMFWTLPSHRVMWVLHPPFPLVNAIVSSHLASWWILLWLMQSDQWGFHYQGACCLPLLQDGDCSLLLGAFQQISLCYFCFWCTLKVGILILVELAILCNVTAEEFLGEIYENHLEVNEEKVISMAICCESFSCSF